MDLSEPNSLAVVADFAGVEATLVLDECHGGEAVKVVLDTGVPDGFGVDASGAERDVTVINANGPSDRVDRANRCFGLSNLTAHGEDHEHRDGDADDSSHSPPPDQIFRCQSLPR